MYVKMVRKSAKTMLLWFWYMAASPMVLRAAGQAVGPGEKIVVWGLLERGQCSREKGSLRKGNKFGWLEGVVYRKYGGVGGGRYKGPVAGAQYPVRMMSVVRNDN